MKKKIFIFSLAASLIITLILPWQSLNAASAVSNQPSVPAPTLLGPGNNLITDDYQVLIKGLAKNGSKVRVYLDNRLLTEFFVVNQASGTANFAFRNNRLLSIGVHYVHATAVDSQGRETRPSNGIKFRFELPYPAPTLLYPKPGAIVSDSQIPIRGVAKDGATIKVYIDEVYNGEFRVSSNNQSQFQSSSLESLPAVDFAYQPFLKLTPGEHTVYTVAVDARGKQSKISDKITFKVAERLSVPETTQTVKAETQDVKSTTDEKVSEIIKEEKVAADKEVTSETSEEQTTNENKSAASQEEGKGVTKSNNWIWLVVGVLVIAIAYWYFTRGKEEDKGLKLPKSEGRSETKPEPEVKPEIKTASKQETMFKADQPADQAKKESEPEETEPDIPPPPPNI